MEHIKDCLADITFVTETWLTSQCNDVTALINTHNYELKHIFRQDDIKQGGGGVGIICHRKYHLRSIKSVKFQSFEHCVFSLAKHKHDKIVLVSVYRLQHMPFDLFLQEFPLLLETLCSMNCVLLIGGDLNVHLNNRSDQHCQSLLSLLESFNLHQLVEGPTQKKGNTLDVLICNDPDICHDVSVADVGLSDHFLITGTVDYCPNSIAKYKTITFRKLHQVNHNAFAVDLNNQIMSSNIYHESQFDLAVSSYNTALRAVLDVHAPLITKTIKDVPRAPWFDREYSDLRRKRRKAEKLYRKTKLMVHKLEFIRLRNMTTALALDKKISFYRNNINNSPNTSKALYRTVNKLIGKDIQQVFPPAESDTALANEFGEYYSSKVKNIRHNIESNTADNTTEDFSFIDNHSTVSFSSLDALDPTTDDEIREIIKERGVKCCFSDPLPAPLTKENLELLIPVWTHLVNLSLSQGTMVQLKHADIIPILKAYGLDPELHSNFRPVSNLQFLGKLIERIVLKRLNAHLIKNNLNVPNQYGYKSAHSTESILIKISNDILIASDRKTATVLLLLDLSAAFDTVDVNVLLSILQREIGISGKALQWFRSFLTGRTMCVKINNSFSDTFILEFGIPQGSVLGPVLFNLYVRSVYKYVEGFGFEIKGFADDHQVYASFSPNYQYHYLGQKINDVLNTMTKWMNSFFLKLNPNKTQIIVFGPNNIRNDIYIKGTFIDNSCIRFNNVVKNLGVLFDSDMSFSSQINNVVSSVFANIKNISRIKSFLTIKEKCILVCSLILSKIDYCNSLYYGINGSLHSKLQYAQNCAARLIYQRWKYDHVKDIFIELHWLPVRFRIIYSILLTVHKCLYHTSPTELNNLIIFESTRTFNLQIPRHHTSYGDRAFSVYSAKEWNSLPLELKTESSLVNFKKLLKTYLFNSCYDTT